MKNIILAGLVLLLLAACGSDVESEGPNTIVYKGEVYIRYHYLVEVLGENGFEAELVPGK